MAGVLGEIKVGRPPQLFLDDQRLFQQLEAPGQELVLDLQEVALLSCKRNKYQLVYTFFLW